MICPEHSLQTLESKLSINDHSLIHLKGSNRENKEVKIRGEEVKTRGD